MGLSPSPSFTPHFLEVFTHEGLQVATDEAVCLAVVQPQYVPFAIATASMAEIETRIGYDSDAPPLAYRSYLEFLQSCPPSQFHASAPTVADFTGDVLEQLALGMAADGAWSQQHWRRAVSGVIEAGGLADLTLAAENAFGLSGIEDSPAALARVRHLEQRLSSLKNESLAAMSLTPLAHKMARKHRSSPTSDSRLFLEMVHALEILHHALHEDDFVKGEPGRNDLSLHQSLIDGRFSASGLSLGILTSHLLLAFGLSTYFDFPLAPESLVMPLKLGLFFHPWEGLSSPKDWGMRNISDISRKGNEDLLYAVHLLRISMARGKIDALLEGTKQMYPELTMSK